MDGLAHAAVAAEPPSIPLNDIQCAVRRQYGIDGDFSPLVSERDQNFHLKSTAGHEYVVKVTSSAEPAIVSEFHIAALLHLETIETPRVPKIVRTLEKQTSGDIRYAGKNHMLRVVSYLEGAPMASVCMDQKMASDFGAALAGLDIGFLGFSHEGECPVLLWDLQRATELRELLDHIDDPNVRRSVTHALHDFQTLVTPMLGKLRCQVIHGDANPGNVLTDPRSHRVTGFIDFGDMVRAPLVFDVAIAAAYLRTEDTDPLDLIAPFVVAYNTARPLKDVEMTLLFDLVRARLATTITLLFWRMAARHHDDPYRKKTRDEEAGAIHFLDALDALGRAEFSTRMKRALLR
jgi:Ser/Thr protein kinase RdoA (MazF antagonist)